MSSVLVVDDMPIFREPIAASLRLAGFEVATAGDGREALELVGRKRPDLILLDLAMPVMDGISFLRALRGRPETHELPVLLLTAHSDRTRVLEAGGLGIAGYLLKAHFSLKDLLERVTKISGSPAAAAGVSSPAAGPKCATASAAPADAPRVTAAAGAAAGHAPAPEQAKLVLLTREQTRGRLLGIKGTQTCAGVVAQVMALTSSPHTDVGDLSRVLEADPILASRVLQLSNSPMFRSKYNRLSSIGEAVRNVGTRAIQNMVISMSIFQAFPPDAGDGFNTLRSWQHSFAVAAILRELLAQQSESERERVALIGLCHDLGEIVLRQHFAAEYAQILAHSERTGQPPAAVEATALSMRHSELVNEVITRIGLPSNIAIPIVCFHEGAQGRSAENTQAVRALQIANWTAHGMLLAPSSAAPVTPIPRVDLARAGGGKDGAAIDWRGLRDQVLTATNALARLPAADERRFVKPLHERAEAAVWYARHAGYADLDPLGAALDMLAQVRHADRLPETEAELQATELVIVAAPFMNAAPLMVAGLRQLTTLPGYHGQQILALLGNSGGAVTMPQVTFLHLPVAIDTLAEAIAHAGDARKRAV